MTRPGLSISPQDRPRGLWTAREVVVVALLSAGAAAVFYGLCAHVVPPVLRGVTWVVVVLLAAGGML